VDGAPEPAQNLGCLWLPALSRITVDHLAKLNFSEGTCAELAHQVLQLLAAQLNEVAPTTPDARGTAHRAAVLNSSRAISAGSRTTG
jgi:hypothetical protein